MEKILIKLDDHEFCAKKINFSTRVLGNLKGGWLFYIIIFFGVGIIASSFKAALLILLFFLVWNLVEYYSWSKYQLIRLVLSEGTLKIEYLQKDLPKTVEDQKGKFSFEKKRVWYKRLKLMYLIIYYNDEVLLKQYPMAGIDEAQFDAIIERF